MKKNFLLAFFAAALTTVTHAVDKSDLVTPNATNRFVISGMFCEGCAGGLKTELKLTPGVATAEVSLTNKLAIVAYDTNRTSSARLVSVITEAGFEARLVSP